MDRHENPTGTGSSSSSSFPKRRDYASLSPAKERHPPLPRGSDNQQQRPKLPNRPHSSSSNLMSGSRPPTKPPPLPRRSIAVSQEETCLVSAAGDVMVSRGREFVQLMGIHSDQFGNLRSSGSNVSRNGSMGWCDLECSKLPLQLEKSALCNPWLTRLGGQREEKKEDDRATQEYAGGLRGGSTYEWEAPTGDMLANGVANGAWSMGQLETAIDDATSPARISPDQLDEIEDEDDQVNDVLAMPSFDYSHFGAGGNDMLPTSPYRYQTRRHSDPVNVGAYPEARDPQDALSYVRRQLPAKTTEIFKHTSYPTATPSPPFYHGVPTFLSSLSQVRIQQVSAHPLGSHVLMISTDALLFSYGLNDHGQLGIGIKSPEPSDDTGSHSDRYVWTPTIITPLLENGGKAITCAAGESHSLVVVSTEGRRILKSQQADSQNQCDSPQTIKMNRVCSSPPSMDTGRENTVKTRSSSEPSISTSESVRHHQLYGFGRNNFTKIGLVHPRRKSSHETAKQSKPADAATETTFGVECHQDDMEDILLPHRVALHCTVWPECTTNKTNPSSELCTTLPQGIFALAASSEHSAALVRRATGSIELYTWGNAAYHALGLSQEEMSTLRLSKTAPVPTLVKKLSLSVGDQSSDPSNSLLEQSPPEYPVDVSLGPYSSYVVTSKGRCFSFGISYDGMLGQGRNVCDSQEPTAIQFPRDTNPFITSVSAGSSHVMALTKDGTVFSWGKNTDGRLGLGENLTTLPGNPAEVPEEVPETEQTIEWTPSKVSRPFKGVGNNDLPPKGDGSDNQFGPVVQVCAGLDCSIFVTESGQVFSCGKHSGRLGLGEADQDVHSPTPLFGGLSLWHRPIIHRPLEERRIPSPRRSPRHLLKRGMTTG